jgi:hypothetical protein
MTQTELHIRPADATAVARIDAAIAQHGLLTTMKGTLKACPGSTHWHCKLAGQPGTLEITLWPADRRAWFKVQSGRRARWIEKVMPKLKRALESSNTSK